MESSSFWAWTCLKDLVYNFDLIQCLIDLKKNVLSFNDGMIVTRFLSDGEINKNKSAPKKEDM